MHVVHVIYACIYISQGFQWNIITQSTYNSPDSPDSPNSSDGFGTSMQATFKIQNLLSGLCLGVTNNQVTPNNPLITL